MATTMEQHEATRIETSQERDTLPMPVMDAPPARPAETPMDLLRMAVSADADVAKLEKLMDLQERWEKNQAEKAFAIAMHACQQEMPRIVRDAQNNQTRSKYARLENVQDKCQPIYSKHGFSISYGEADCPVAGHKRTVCDVRHTGGACHSYHLDLPIDGIGPKGNAIGGMNAVQGCISTTSYGQRRLLCMIFNIILADEDKDGTGDQTPVTEQQAAQLRDLCDDIGQGEEAKCIEWIRQEFGSHIESFWHLPAKHLKAVTDAINAKRAKARR